MSAPDELLRNLADGAAPPVAQERLRPREWYDALKRRPDFTPDPAQGRAVESLHRLHDELAAWRRPLLPFRWLAPKAPKGLYLWGGVGRGKSFLMDQFFAHAPVEKKRRLHFHRFMQEAHGLLDTLKGRRDPLAEVARRLAVSARLLCLDEFPVSDIADAMILSRLLKELLDRGTVLVLTSNQEPDRLYVNGLQRDAFLPAIALLKARLETVQVDNGEDYRLRFLERAEVYHLPDRSDALGRLEIIFGQVTEGGETLSPTLRLQGRQVAALRRAAGAVWFDFKQICGTPRSQTDYLEIAREYPTVLVSGVPRMVPEQSAEARRFTWLVDVCYDRRVKLIVSADGPPEALYPAGLNSAEFTRTASRLYEMQSRHYLAAPHLAKTLP